MIRAISIDFLQIYPSHISDIIDEIMASGEFRPANLVIEEEEVPIRNLHPLEMALFTAMLNVRDKHTALSSAPPLSSLEEILLGDYTKQYKLLDKLLTEAIMLDSIMADYDADRIGIREGHIIVLMPKKKTDFVITMFQPDCLRCPSYIDCDHPEKMTL